MDATYATNETTCLLPKNNIKTGFKQKRKEFIPFKNEF